MIIQSAQIYSTDGALAYQLDYTDGCSVRTIRVMARDTAAIIEIKTAGEWQPADCQVPRIAGIIQDLVVTFCQ